MIWYLSHDKWYIYIHIHKLIYNHLFIHIIYMYTYYLSLSIAISKSLAKGWRRAKPSDKKEQVSPLVLLLAASWRHSMPWARKKLPLLFDTNEMVQKTSESLSSEGHLCEFAQGSFGTEELAGGKYCATTTHCSRRLWNKAAEPLPQYDCLRHPLTRSSPKKQRSRGWVTSQTKTCCPWKLPWRHRRVHMHFR